MRITTPMRPETLSITPAHEPAHGTIFGIRTRRTCKVRPPAPAAGDGEPILVAVEPDVPAGTRVR